MNQRVDIIRRLARPLAPEPSGIDPHADPLPGIRAVVFDVYGTLFVSASGDVGTLLQGDRSPHLADALADAGIEGRLPEASVVGIRLFHDAIADTHAALRARGVLHPEIDVQRIWADVLDHLARRNLIEPGARSETTAAVAVGYEMRVNPVWPMPGTRRLLRRLSACEWPMGIVSNAQFYTPLLFEALLDGALPSLGFDPALCAWSWRTGEAKPSGRLFAPVLHGLNARGISPGEVLYVGNDMLNDIATAAAAGCHTVLFAGDRRSLRLRVDDPRCTAVRPDRVITRIGDLAGILGLLTDR